MSKVYVVIDSTHGVVQVFRSWTEARDYADAYDYYCEEVDFKE